jgi:hypothetical protein
LKQNIKIFTESVILAAIPALGYWVAFVYELGYFNYFDLPRDFIEITLNLILLNSLSVVSGLVLFIIVFDFIQRSMLGVTEALKYTLYKLLFIYFIAFGFGLVFDKTNNEILVLLLILAGPIILKEILWPLWSYRHIQGFGNKVAAAKKKDFEFDSLTDKIAEKTGATQFTLLIFIYLTSIFAYLAGGYQANKQEYFLTSEANPNYVLIRQYANNWLALKIDVETHEFHKTYELIPTDKISKFSSTNIGKLKIRQEESAND